MKYSNPEKISITIGTLVLHHSWSHKIYFNVHELTEPKKRLRVVIDWECDLLTVHNVDNLPLKAIRASDHERAGGIVKELLTEARKANDARMIWKTRYRQARSQLTRTHQDTKTFYIWNAPYSVSVDEDLTLTIRQINQFSGVWAHRVLHRLLNQNQHIERCVALAMTIRNYRVKANGEGFRLP